MQVHKSFVLFSAFVALLSCGQVSKNQLTYSDRQIIGGLYFGMDQDSIEIVLKKNLQMDNFTIVDCWQNILSPTKRYCYSNFCDFSFAKQIPMHVQMGSSEPPFEQGHYGLVIPVVSNKRLSEVYVVLGNYSRKYSYPDFSPFMSANIIDEVKYKLNKEYGKDSLAIESNAKVAILSEVNTNFTTIPSIVWKYKAKFGAVELVHGQHTDDVHFSDNLYW
ncbi:MAG: hypothetical protein RL040_506, partial [Bacteroidota bacterium]